MLLFCRLKGHTIFHGIVRNLFLAHLSRVLAIFVMNFVVLLFLFDMVTKEKKHQHTLNHHHANKETVVTDNIEVDSAAMVATRKMTKAAAIDGIETESFPDPQTIHPSRRPTKEPSYNNPTMLSSAPTTAVASCGGYYTATDTNSARRNTANCAFTACSNLRIVISACGTCTSDT